MKKILLLIGISLCMAAVGYCEDVSFIDRPIIQVNGQAEIKVVPDQVAISISVETKADELEQAKSLNDQNIIQVTEFVRSIGVDKKDVQTSRISIHPQYDYNKSLRRQENIPSAYSVTRSMSVLLKDVEKFEKLLSGVITSGANNVYGIQFQTSELDKYKEEARAQAINTAKDKAVKMAAELNQKIGQPLAIIETNLQMAAPYLGQKRLAGAASFGSAEIAMASESVLSLGQISVTAGVDVIFEMIGK